MMLRSERARRPRVLMLIENVPLARDHRLRKQAAALLASRFEVTVICQRDPRNKACVPGVRVLEYPAPPEGSGLLAFAGEYGYSVVMAAVLTLWAFVRHGFDVLQVASTPDIYFLLAAPCRWLGRPVVFDFRDPSPETYEARYGSGHGATYRALLLLERWSLRAADRVLVVNESLPRVAPPRGGGRQGGVQAGGRPRPGRQRVPAADGPPARRRRRCADRPGRKWPGIVAGRPPSRPARAEARTAPALLLGGLDRPAGPGRPGPEGGRSSGARQETDRLRVRLRRRGRGSARGPPAGPRARHRGLGELSRLGAGRPRLRLPVNRRSRARAQHGGVRVSRQGDGVSGGWSAGRGVCGRRERPPGGRGGPICP